MLLFKTRFFSLHYRRVVLEENQVTIVDTSYDSVWSNPTDKPAVYLAVDFIHPNLEGDNNQVWSLTQFFSVNFSHSWIIGKFCFYSQTFKVCITCFWLCPTCLPQHTWQGPCRSVFTEAIHEAKLGSWRSNSKSHTIVRDDTVWPELLRGSKESNTILLRGYWFAL